MVFIPSLLNLGEFLLCGNGLFVIVRVRLARKLSASIAGIEAEFADVIAGLRLVPRKGPVSCELWLYSRYGTQRHFRVWDTRLAEIDGYGMPVDPAKPVVTGLPPCGSDTPSSDETTAAGLAPPGTTALRNPILRWLARRNAAEAGTGTGAMGNNELKKILDAGIPGTKAKRTPGKKPVSNDPAPAVPVNPEKSAVTVNSVAGANRHAGKKAVSRTIDGAVPEEKPEPEKPVLGEILAPLAGTVSVSGDQSPDSTAVSPGISHDTWIHLITGGGLR
jgi:hypothetical protein